MQTGVIIVDHGSRRDQSNSMLLDAAAMFKQHGDYAIVEPAHMELAQPSIATAFDRCVADGAQRVIVFPYFLFPGRHWSDDIPALTAAAAKKHPGIRYLVTAPFGLHPSMTQIITDRIANCAERTGDASCDVCQHDDKCQWQ